MVPQFFRDAGYPVFTIKDEYGRRNVEDEEWLHDAGTRGWVVVAKDSRIRRRPKELSAVVKARARVVCVVPGDMGKAEEVACLRDNLSAIQSWWEKPGPWILAVRRDGVEELSLASDPAAE